MSQTVSTNLVLPEPSEELIVSEPWTIETYADGLMDELFSDIDSILDGSSNLSSQIVQAQQLIADKAQLPQIVPPQTIINSLQETKQHHRVGSTKFDTVVNYPPQTARTFKKPPRRIWRNLRQLLKIGAGLGLAIAAINWAINNGLLNRLTSKSLQFALQEPQLQQKILRSQNQAPTQAEIKSDLAEYMLGALTIIDREEKSQNKSSVNKIVRPMIPVATNPATPAYRKQTSVNLPSPKIANNAKPLPSRTTRVVERIYIPVYQAPQPMRYTPPTVAQAPTPLPPIKTADKKAAPKPSNNTAKKAAPVKVAKAKAPKTITAFATVREMKPVAVKTKPVNVRKVPELPKIKEPAKVPAPKQAAAPAQQKVASVSSNQTSSDIPAPVQQKKQKVASSNPVSSHILEGLMELGEQSAALFKVNGVSRRIKIGESIGASGWTLVDVANGEAIIRRNGEVRSIFAGQKF